MNDFSGEIIRFSSVKCVNPEKLVENWSRKNYRNHSAFHSIASYPAMFAPSLPKHFIKEFSQPGDLVFDPFSGRGTTALVARELNRKFIGFDLNPYSYILTKAKIGTYDIDYVLKKIVDLEIEYSKKQMHYLKKTLKKECKELNYFYSRNNLAQLLYLRDKIGSNWLNVADEEVLILAIALGLMHGPTRKDGSSIYFSLKMPNTISMSPNYVRNYSKRLNLKKPKTNIFLQLKNRIHQKYDKILSLKWNGKMFFQDALNPKKILKDNSVDLIVTSPPYLNIVNYTGSNWLKLWLLGFERQSLRQSIRLSDNFSFDKYVLFIKKFLVNIHSKIKEGGKICLVVGDVHESKLVEEVWERIEKEVPYNFKFLYFDHNYKQNNKITNMLNKKAGRATLIEKVLVIEKV